MTIAKLSKTTCLLLCLATAAAGCRREPKQIDAPKATNTYSAVRRVEADKERADEASDEVSRALSGSPPEAKR